MLSVALRAVSLKGAFDMARSPASATLLNLSGTSLVKLGWTPLRRWSEISPASGSPHIVDNVRQGTHDLDTVAHWPDSRAPGQHAVNANGDLLVSVDNSSDTAASWIQKGVLAPPLPGVNWATFDQVFPGGDGVIYAIDSTGNLRYFRLLDPWRNAVAMSWSADSNTVIKSGLGTGSLWAGFSRMGDMATSLGWHALAGGELRELAGPVLHARVEEWGPS